MALAGDVAQLIVALRLDDKGFSGKLNNAAKQLKGMDAGLSQMGRGAGQVAGGFARLGAVAGAAAAGGLAAFVTTAASYEKAFIGVEKTTEGTAEELRRLEETLRSMSRSTGFAFEELAGIAETGGALGVGIEQMEEFTDVIARLAVSTDLTADTAATAMGELRTILQLGDGELRAVADTLVALGNAGASTEPQIVELAARFAAAGNRAGLTADEILALSSAVTSMGVEVEAGGTALSQTFNEIALAIGKGGKEVEGFTSVLGISASEFERRWRQDALGTFQEFLSELNKLDPIAQSVALEMAGITGQRQINAVGLMADNYQFLGEQLEVTKNDLGALNTESDKFLATTAQQWNKLKENVRDAAAVLGTELLPVVNEAMGAFVEWLNQADTQAGLKDFAKDLAEGVRSLVGELKGTDFSGMIGGLKLAAEVAKGAFDAFRALPAPIQQLAIAALVANKVSGGAIGSIAAGLGNLLLGSLKTITAANVTVIGGNVTGGPGGVGGKGGGFGGSLLGGLKTGAALASPVLAGVAAVEVVNFMEMRSQATGKLESILDDMPRETAHQLDTSIARIEGQIAQDRPLLDAIVFNTNVKPVLERELTELQAQRRQQEIAAGLLRDAIPWHERNVAAINNFNASEANRHSLTQGALNTIAAKDFNPEVNLHNNITIPVSVTARMITQRVYEQNVSTNGWGQVGVF